MNSDELYEGSHSKVVDTGLVGLVNRRLHLHLEKNISKEKANYKRILELGAGMGQHLKFVEDNYLLYVQSDIRVKNLPKNFSDRVINKKINAEDLSGIKDASFDRLVSTCLLVHLQQPEQALVEWRRVVCPGGALSIYVPCEPGLLLRFSRYFSTHLKAKKLGYDHLSIHYREHVSYFVRLNKLIKEVFNDCKVKRSFFPLNFIPSWNLNLWAVYQIKLPKIDDKNFLSTKKGAKK